MLLRSAIVIARDGVADQKDARQIGLVGVRNPDVTPSSMASRAEGGMSAAFAINDEMTKTTPAATATLGYFFIQMVGLCERFIANLQPVKTLRDPRRDGIGQPKISRAVKYCWYKSHSS